MANISQWRNSVQKPLVWTRLIGIRLRIMWIHKLWSSNRALMVKPDQEDSRVCLARKETKGPEVSPGYPDPSDFRWVHVECIIIIIIITGAHTHARALRLPRSVNTWQRDHVERSLVHMHIALPAVKASQSEMGSSTARKPTAFHLPLHHLHYIKRAHNLLMQPRLLIALCIAPGQIMLFSYPTAAPHRPPSRTFP